MVKRIGGKTCKKHIRNALSLTLSDDLVYRMSWTGAKGTIMVKNMQHMEIIKGYPLLSIIIASKFFLDIFLACFVA